MQRAGDAFLRECAHVITRVRRRIGSTNLSNEFANSQLARRHWCAITYGDHYRAEGCAR